MADNQPPMPPDVTGPAGSPSPPPRPPSDTAPPAGEQLSGAPPPPPPPLPEAAGPASPQPSSDPPPLFFTPPLAGALPRPGPPAGSGEPAAQEAAPSALPDLRAPSPFEATFEAPSATNLTKPPRRRRTWLIALIAVLVVLIGGGAAAAGLLLTRTTGSKAGPTAPANPSASAAQATPQPTPSTVSYTDPDQYYTAQFDNEPKYHATSQTSPVGNVPYRYAEYVGPDVDQLVGVLVFSPGTTFDTTKGLEGIASAGSGSVISSAPSTFQGYPSLEGVINLQGDYLKVQIVHVGNLAYIIGTAGPVNPPSDYGRFLAAVHITPH